MINWPKLKFPPINLWNNPAQEIDYMREQINSIKLDIKLVNFGIIAENKLQIMRNSHLKLAENRLKNLEFLYYTRRGKFPD